LDEKWSFVCKKQKNCANDDKFSGDNWDHVAYDPEHKLVVAVVPGKRTLENTDQLVAEMKERTGGKQLNLISSDEYKPYTSAILKHYGDEIQPERSGTVGRLPKPIKVPSKGLNYVVVHKTRKNGRVEKIEPKIIFGEENEIAEMLAQSNVSRCINTSFIERYNATDRHQNGRKARCTYEFSKKWEIHNWFTYFVTYTYNFCWPVRTLRRKNKDGKYEKRTPAMAAKLTDHVWSLEEWLSMPVVQ
jgi:IS1 family transposase